MKQLRSLLTKASASAVGFATFAGTAFAAEAISVNVQNKGFAMSFGGLMNGLLSFVMVIAALLVFFYLIWGGIEWITSGGDKGQTEKARNKITAAIIGLVILAAAYAVLTLALNFLGFNDLNDVFSRRRTIDDAQVQN